MSNTLDQDEICPSTLHQAIDSPTDQKQTIAQSVEQYQTNTLITEPLSASQSNTANQVSIADESEDVPLLAASSIPSPQNRMICIHYWLEILVGFVIFTFVVMVIILGLLFTKNSKTSTVAITGCNKLSATGKSCSIDNLETITLTRHKFSTFDQKSKTLSFKYTALSTRTIITFDFDKTREFYLDNISIRDMLDNVELMEDGSFESGTMYAYCLCESNSVKPTMPVKKDSSSAFKVCEISSFFSAVQLSQPVNTIAGHQYNVSFWIETRSSSDQIFTVYMSSALKMNPHFLLLLFSVFLHYLKNLDQSVEYF